MPRKKRRRTHGGQGQTAGEATRESAGTPEEQWEAGQTAQGDVVRELFAERRRPAHPPAQQAPRRMNAAERRQAQREARLHASKTERRKVWLFAGGGVAALVALILVLVFVVGGGGASAGEVTPNDGRRHIAQGASAGSNAYSTDPPSSGDHWLNIRTGKRVSTREPDESLIHNLEHGYIVMHHNCTSAECPEIVDGLDRIHAGFSTKVILNYRPETDSRIALTAWLRLDKMEEFDEQRIRDFIDAYRGKKPAPEASAP